MSPSLSARLPVPPAPSEPGLSVVSVPVRSSSAWCVWPQDDQQRGAGGSARSSSTRDFRERRCVDHDDIDLADPPCSQTANARCSASGRGAAVFRSRRREALERVVVAGDPQPGDALTTGPGDRRR